MAKSTRRVIENQTYEEERSLYFLSNADVVNCTFAGEKDGESVLKDSRNVSVRDCKFSLRYPLWHAQQLQINHVTMDDKARAPLWYGDSVVIDNCDIQGIKCLRETSKISIRNSNIISDEFGWKCHEVNISNCSIDSQYALFESENVVMDNVKLTGKYTLQYMANVKVTNCVLDTKDAFWHSHNVLIKDCVVKGEYLGWYSDGLTFINCKIISHQPLVDCKNLTLVNCTMEGCDLAFEYSDVNADIIGSIESIKNPRSGIITVDSVNDVITGDEVIPCKGKVVIR